MPQESKASLPKAKIEFEEDFFRQVKGHIEPRHYVECGKCGAVEVDALAFAHMLYDTPDADLDDLAFDYLQMNKLVHEPTEEDYKKWLNYEEWLKFEAANEHRFFIAEDYGEGTCIKYDKVILFCDPDCDCFGKDKVERI